MKTLQSSDPNKPNYIMLSNVKVKVGVIDDELLRAWEQIEIWYGDPKQREKGEALLIRVQKMLEQEYASQFKKESDAVEFADWLMKNCTMSKDNSIWSFEGDDYTLEKLYQLFLTDKKIK